MSSNLPSLISHLHRLDPFTVGFGSLFDQLDMVTNQQTGFPKYNIEHYSDDKTEISVALAGYDENEIKVSLENNQLTISADIHLDDRSSNEYQGGFKGIAHRSFSQKFILGEHVEVKDATFKNGLLVVTLQKNVPEEKKLKLIPINKK